MSAAVPGTVALWATLLLALAAVVTGRRRLLVLAAVAATSSTIVLGVALLLGDFSLAYVAETTSRATPWPYRIAALWGGMDGSMLFYTTLTLWASVVGLRGGGETRVASLVSAGLCALTLGFADPFTTLPIPAVDGQGLLAILQHPAMIYHPPLLYLGLVTLVVPFAITVVDRAVTDRRVRGWLYLSWTLLVAGMAAGANWAYVELGWGGFWAWDPVENTALMPWLAVTAFLHVSRVSGSTGRLRRLAVFLATVPFALSVLGVYLTRSGVTGSIHSFAEDPVVGRVLLVSAVAVGLAAMVTALRSPPGDPWGRFRLDRHGWMTLSGAVLVCGLVFVTVGTAYPAFVSVFTSRTVTVGARFFAMTMLPVGMLAAASLGLSLGAGWRVWSSIAVLAGGTSIFAGPSAASPLLAVAAASLIAVLVRTIRRRPSGRTLVAHLAHMGTALALVGVAGSASGAELATTMRPGDRVTLSGHTVVLEDVVTGETERYVFARATVLVDGRPLYPEIRAYEGQDTPIAEPRLASSPLVDVIVMTSLLFPDGETVEVSVLVRPLVWWVWVGAVAIAGSGLLALRVTAGDVSGRHRQATPGRQRGGTTSGSVAR